MTSTAKERLELCLQLHWTVYSCCVGRGGTDSGSTEKHWVPGTRLPGPRHMKPKSRPRSEIRPDDSHHRLALVITSQRGENAKNPASTGFFSFPYDNHPPRTACMPPLAPDKDPKPLLQQSHKLIQPTAISIGPCHPPPAKTHLSMT
jgi:hypothetical protein